MLLVLVRIVQAAVNCIFNKDYTINMKSLCIATRGSQLALWQANYIKSLLEEINPSLQINLEIIKTQGDKILDVALAKVGGKGLFVKEIEEALLDKRADIAVHSLKDVPMVLPQGLTIASYLERETPFDLFISEKFESFEALPQNATLGTSSLRRQAQALSMRPDLNIKLLRGNVETRINKMKMGEYDAIILAHAGVKRLNLAAKFTQNLLPPLFLPAVGQGALALEVRADDVNIQSLLSKLDHEQTRKCVEAERAFMRTLEGGCQVPIAAYATIDQEDICLQARIARPDGSQTINAQYISKDAEECGIHLANQMKSMGAQEILDALVCDNQ